MAGTRVRTVKLRRAKFATKNDAHSSVTLKQDQMRVVSEHDFRRALQRPPPTASRSSLSRTRERDRVMRGCRSGTTEVVP
jgi:hypothetical protein